MINAGEKVVAALDDDASIVELYKTILEEEGYRLRPVVFSPRLPVVLENIRKTRPHLLLLDIHLPGLGSFEIMQGMLSDEELAQIKVLVCSASRPSLEALRNLMHEAGSPMPAVLEKPFDLDDLLKLVRELTLED
ncbi:MAG TPA: response regulator [Chloroflexia bacterium]|nr:response regulator [Chloroflexia bacterium]